MCHPSAPRQILPMSPPCQACRAVARPNMQTRAKSWYTPNISAHHRALNRLSKFKVPLHELHPSALFPDVQLRSVTFRPPPPRRLFRHIQLFLERYTENCEEISSWELL